MSAPKRVEVGWALGWVAFALLLLIVAMWGCP
jgi:hypothetical protein